MNITPKLCANGTSAQTILNWILPILGVIAFLLVIIFVWRYIRHSNQAGRISEFSERTLKKIIEDENPKEHHPKCPNCKMPMRLEIRYKDFMKDQGEFLINRDSSTQILKSLVECQRINQGDMNSILAFFESQPKIEQYLFRRYKCQNCLKVIVLPYNSLGKEKK